MSKLLEILIERKRAVFLLLIMLYIWGISSYVNIAKEDNPSIQIPIAMISLSQVGISTEDAERLLVKPIENALKTIRNLKKMRSESYFNGGYIILEFKSDTNIKEALDDVRDKVNKAKSLLPKDALEPEILEINLSEDDVLSVALFGDISEKALGNIARDLREKIKEIPDVLDAKIIGARGEELQIIINPVDIYNKKINLDEVISNLSANNNIQAIGKYSGKTGSFGIKIDSVIKEIGDVRDIPVQADNNQITTLKDLADIKIALGDRVQVAKINGLNVIGINVQKRSSANIISTIEMVKKIVEYEKEFWPENVSHVYSLDSSKEIKESVSGLENTVILEIILSIIPIVLSIGLRSALLVAFAIPTSFLFGVMVIDMLGYTMNVVVIFSLILSVGMLVDASIVVCEYAETRIKEGATPKAGYILAASKMWWPVFSSTITTLIVYVPLFFWPGVIGKFMYFMPLTIFATVSSSLIVAYSFIPVLGVSFPRRKATKNKEMAYGKIQQAIIDRYEIMLNKVLDKPAKFASFIFGILCVVLILFACFGAGFEFFPKTEAKAINIDIESKDPLSLEQIGQVVEKVENILQSKFKNEMKIIYSNFGSGLNRNKIANISLQMVHWKNRRNGELIQSDIRRELSGIYGVKIEVTANQDGPPNKSPLMLEISSAYPKLLDEVNQKIYKIVVETEGLVDINNNFNQKQFEWEVVIDKVKAAKYGVDARLVGKYVQMITKGLKLSTYRPDYLTYETDIILKFISNKKNLESLKTMHVNGRKGPVAITNFVKIIPTRKIQSISRINGQRSISINANIESGVVLDNKISEISKKISELNIDPRVRVKFAGEKESMEETGTFLKSAFALALLSMFLVILIQFNSYFESLVIMTAVFLSTTGVLLGLLLTSQPFGVVMCGLGIIALAGVVVNNNIIFIDTYKDLLKSGMDRREAIIETGRTRIRPILLTAITAVLGLLPMVIGFDIDFLSREINIDPPSSRWWKQLSITISGGLGFATILTLFFTPSLLILEPKIKNFIKEKFKKIC